jgi:biotin synthase
MKINSKLERILDAAQQGAPPSREDCAYLLSFPEASIEASCLRAVADAASRERYGNESIVLGQIGIEISACPGRCGFCSFGEGHTTLQPGRMEDGEILAGASSFTASRELYALFLMTMHTFDFDRLLHVVRTVREKIPVETRIVVNIGDFDRAQALDLKAAGVNGAYHIRRLREGIDTALKPEQREATIRTIKDCGLDWFYCCEPVGPEHSPEELAEQIYLGIEYGCFQHAAMRRVYIPSAPLAPRGQISELRLAQVVAAVALASLGCPDTRSIAVHEPNLLGLAAGANTVYAETGANPRDTETETTGHRGRDIAACKRMLYEAGFAHLLVSPGKRISLAEAFRH